MRELKLEELQQRAGGKGACGRDKGHGHHNSHSHKRSRCSVKS